MPNLDGGHLFLTALVAVRTDTVFDPAVSGSRSHRHMLSETLALIPTGRQTAASDPQGPGSPFSRNTLNHFARFVIIDGPAFNGRSSEDTLMGVLKGTNPLIAQPVDRSHTYLLFAADIDAPIDADTALKTYTETLWRTMRKEIEGIFRHCMAFESVKDAAAFHDYIVRCQVETTMPFNDYWLDGLDVGGNAVSALPKYVKAAVTIAAVAAAAWLCVVVLNVALAALDVQSGFSLTVARVAAWSSIVGALVIVLVFLAAYGAYRWVLNRGSNPLPTAPGCDLPSVLKALLLQQQFTRFAIEAQGAEDSTLHERFGAFLTAVAPGRATPTQPPGETRSPVISW